MAKEIPLQSPLRLGAAAKSETRTQFGALCFRRSKTRKAAHEILLVSSRDTGRWIVPKGWPVNGETPAGAAAMEAWEEAGVRGRVFHDCIGHFSYHKWIDEEMSLPVIVAVFPIEVLRVDDDFPEAGERKRKWLSPKKAARRVAEPELRHILRGFDPARLRGPAA
jgi:8-oxo-dGTP pyrophosphatase MutT (NUDIX family)